MEIEQIFLTLCRHFASKEAHLSRIILGSSPEQWLNAEAFVALNWASPAVLREGHRAVNECSSPFCHVQPSILGGTVRPRRERRDLAICTGRKAQRRACMMIEAKLIYPLATLDSQLLELRRQLLRPPMVDETPDVRRVGLTYAVFYSADARRALDTPERFLLHAEERLRATFSSPDFTLRRSVIWEQLVRATPIDGGLGPRTVALAATWIEAHNFPRLAKNSSA